MSFSRGCAALEKNPVAQTTRVNPNIDLEFRRRPGCTGHPTAPPGTNDHPSEPRPVRSLHHSSHKDSDMRVLVLGAGLLGVASAYYLQQLGHEVTVVDRHDTPAAKARGRAGATRTPAAAELHRRAAAEAAARATWTRLHAAYGGFTSLLDRAIGGSHQTHRKEHLVRLHAYSRASVRALRDEAGVSHGPRTAGMLSFYCDAAAFDARKALAPHWRKLGCDERLLSADEALQIEPALRAARGVLAGAAYTRDDPARDPAQFAASLVFLCRAAGVRFITAHTVLSLQEHRGSVEQVRLLDADGQPVALRAQAYVLALGSSSVLHAEKLKIPLPLGFRREYVVTVPLKDTSLAPRVALHDRQARLRIGRVDAPGGECLRISRIVRVGRAESAESDAERFDAMLRHVEALLPGAGDAARASFETATHAVSRTGLPVIGKTRLGNLFLNTAPGARDWTNACGAGRSIARIVSGLRPELEFAFRSV
ncbi:MAG: FAD-dependent oxidoreductase [Variovorax sp.]